MGSESLHWEGDVRGKSSSVVAGVGGAELLERRVVERMEERRDEGPGMVGVGRARFSFSSVEGAGRLNQRDMAGKQPTFAGLEVPEIDCLFP
jgi:hypothetical protein